MYYIYIYIVFHFIVYRNYVTQTSEHIPFFANIILLSVSLEWEFLS